jgi:hypothetical protein
MLNPNRSALCETAKKRKKEKKEEEEEKKRRFERLAR